MRGKLAIIAALPRELAPFRRVAPAGAMMFACGMGGKQARAVAAQAIEGGPSAVLAVGYAGGLEPETCRGDVLLATAVHADEPGREPIVCGEALTEWISVAMERSGLRYRRGPLVTAGAIAQPEAKRDLGRRFAGVAVDMESYWIAREAAQAGVPFLAIRVISDAMEDTLPDFPRFQSPGGGVSPSRALRYFAGDPRRLALAARSGRNVAAADRSLRRVAECLRDAAITLVREAGHDAVARR